MNVFDLSVRLAAVDAFSEVLGIFGSKLLGINTSVENIAKGIDGWKTALAGAVGVFGGTEILKGMSDLEKHGEKWIQIQDNLRAAGDKQLDVQNAVNQAIILSGKYRNESYEDVLGNIAETRTAYGSTAEAAKWAEPMVKMRSALDAFLGKELGETTRSQAFAAVRSSEMYSKGPVSGEQLAHAMDELTRVAMVYQGRVNPSAYLTAQSAANVALINATDQFKYGVFPSLVQEFGDKAGTMLMTAFNKVVIGVSNRAYSLDFMERMGLLDTSDPSKFVRSKAGIITRIDPSIIKGHELLEKDQFIQWLEQDVLPAFTAHGYDSPERQIQGLGMMSVDRKATQFWASLLMAKDRIIKDAALTPLVAGDYSAILANTPNYAHEAMAAQLSNLGTALGAPMVDPMVDVLNKLAGALNYLSTAAAKMDPKTLGIIEEITAGLAGTMTVLGGLAVAGWILKMSGFATLLGLIPRLGAAIGGFLVAMGPPGWIIGAVAGLALLGWYFWPQIKALAGTIGGFLHDLGNAIYDAVMWVVRKIQAALRALQSLAIKPTYGPGGNTPPVMPGEIGSVPSIPRFTPAPGAGTLDVPPGWGPTPQSYRPAPSGSVPLIHATIQTDVHLDGEKLASLLMHKIVQAADGPATDAAHFDPGANYSFT